MPLTEPVALPDDAPHRNHYDYDDRADADQDLDRAERIDADPSMDADYVDTQVIADEDAEYIHLFSPIDRDDMIRTHEEIAKTINLTGGDMRKYRRERRARVQAIVSEI